MCFAPPYFHSYITEEQGLQSMNCMSGINSYIFELLKIHTKWGSGYSSLNVESIAQGWLMYIFISAHAYNCQFSLKTVACL